MFEMFENLSERLANSRLLQSTLPSVVVIATRDSP